MTYVDEYLATVDPERRRVLEHMCGVVREMLPQAIETRSYGLPAFKVGNKSVLGFHAAKNHMALFPFSGAVVARLKDRLAGYSLAAGTIRFTVDRPIPDDLLREVVRCRLDEIKVA